MRRWMLSAVMATALATPLTALAAKWEIDPVHSSAAFSVRHMMVANVRGGFSKVEGTVELDPKNLSKSSVEAKIDATSIYTHNEKRDAHLKSADFFDVEKYPEITFKSKKVSAAGKNKYKVLGDLTMHGVTKEVTLDVETTPTETKDAQGKVKRGATATTKVNRKDFGLTWNRALEAGGVTVGDEVTISIDAELNKAD